VGSEEDSRLNVKDKSHLQKRYRANGEDDLRAEIIVIRIVRQEFEDEGKRGRVVRS
jgi:hypothetical protein